MNQLIIYKRYYKLDLFKYLVKQIDSRKYYLYFKSQNLIQRVYLYLIIIFILNSFFEIYPDFEI